MHCIELVTTAFSPDTPFRSVTQREKEISRAFSCLMKNHRYRVMRKLEAAGCRDAELRREIFFDALLNLKEAGEQKTFSGTTDGEIAVYLSRVAVRRWQKHADNPHREAIKRGRYGKTGDDKYVGDQNRRVNLEVTEAGILPEGETDLPDGYYQAEEDRDPEAERQRQEVREVVQGIIDQLEDDCPDRIRRMKYFNARTDVDPADKDDVVKVSHQENAEDFGDQHAAESRKRQNSCLKKLKELIRQARNNHPFLFN